MSTTSFININDWAFRVGLVGFILGSAAVAVPQWFVTNANALSFGLRSTCVGSTCSIMQFDKLKSTLNCDGSCSDAFDQFRLRWRAVEAFGWLAVVLLLLVVASSMIGNKNEIRPKPLGAAHVMTSISALFAMSISVVVLWASIDCGKKCYEIGGSAATSAAAGLLVVIAIPLGLAAIKVGSRHKRRMWLTLTSLCCLAATGLEMLALLTNKWIFTKAVSNSSFPSTGSVGLFLTCKGASCSALDAKKDLIGLANAAGCTSHGASGGSLTLLLWIGAGLVGLGAILCLVLAFISYRQPAEDHSLEVEKKKEEEEEGEGKDGGGDSSKEEEGTALPGSPQQRQEGTARNDGDDDDDDDGAAESPILGNTQEMMTMTTAAATLDETHRLHAQRRREILDEKKKVVEMSADEYPLTRFLLILTILLLVSAGNGILLYHLDSGLFCGQTFCQLVDKVSKTTSCQYGAACISSLVFNCIIFVLFAAEIVHRCHTACEEGDDGIDEWRKFSDQFKKLRVKFLPAASTGADEQQRSEPGYFETKEAMCMWHRWVSALLLAATASFAALGVARPDWERGAKATSIVFGPFEQCTKWGASCSPYSSAGCGGGEVGSESARHRMVGMAAAIGVGFAVAATCVVFGTSDMLVLGRGALVLCMEVCLIVAVMMWWQAVYSCDGTSHAACKLPSTGGCVFGWAFWYVVGAMGGGGLALLINLVELILIVRHNRAQSAERKRLLEEEEERNMVDEEEEEEEDVLDEEGNVVGTRTKIVTVRRKRKKMSAFARRQAAAAAEAEAAAAAAAAAAAGQEQQPEGEVNPLVPSPTRNAPDDVQQYEQQPQQPQEEQPQQQQPQQQWTADTDPDVVGLPADYRFDPESNYWWAEDGVSLWDPVSGLHGNSETGQWFVDGEWQ